MILRIWHGQLVLPLGQVENSSTCSGKKKDIVIPWGVCNFFKEYIIIILKDKLTIFCCIYRLWLDLDLSMGVVGGCCGVVGRQRCVCWGLAVLPVGKESRSPKNNYQMKLTLAPLPLVSTTSFPNKSHTHTHTYVYTGLKGEILSLITSVPMGICENWEL